MYSVRWFSGSFRVLPTLVAVGAFLVACAPAAPPSPTAAPAKPAPTTAPAKAAEKPAATQAPAAKPAAKEISLPKPERTSLKIGFPTMEPNSYIAKLADELGIYKKYGIEKVEVLFFESSARLVPAHVSGELDAASDSAGPVISSLVTGSPFVQAAMYKNKQQDNLVATSNVKTAADLKGKSIAVGGFGSDAHAAALLAVKALGLAAEDVTIQSIGGQSARIAALKGGSVAAAPVDEALEDEMKQQGFNILVRLSEAPVEFARSGLVFRREWVEKNPNTALAVVAAHLEARQAMNTQTDKVIDGYARWLQAKDKAQAEKEIRTFLKYFRRDLRWSKEAWENHKNVLVFANPAVKDVDVTKGYTFEFLDKLRDMGFNDAVGVPRS